MKRVISLILSFALSVSLFSVCSNAAEPTVQLVSQSVKYLENGDYIVTEIYKPLLQPYSGTSGYSTSTYRDALGTNIFAVTVYGTFSYNGSTSSATGASASVDIYNSNASFVSKNAYTSGSSAYAVGTVRYKGINAPMTTKLTCDRNGNLY